ncbi:MAG: EAL domain-containing protein [Oceanospirillaceae bacterium]|nr:EAL domain-containing protein [Oceanospirillaceae bacterium]
MSAVIFEDDNDGTETDKGAGKLLSVLKRPFKYNNYEMYMPGSIVVVKYPDYGCDVDELIQAADTAMYLAKQSERNNYQVFDIAAQQNLQQRDALLLTLKQALKNNEIGSYYQPIVNQQGENFSFEVLVRRQHPQFGLLEPSRFMSPAEDSGLIAELSYQIILKGIENLSKWQEKNLCSNCRAQF